MDRLDLALVAMLRRLQQARPDPRLAAAVTAEPAGTGLDRAEDIDHATVDSGVLALPVPPLQPVDRLVQALGLSPTDVDLLAVSLLSHRFASAAAAMRDWNPAGLPWPSLGLLAALDAGTVTGVSSWPTLIQALTSSTLLAAGVVAVQGTGPASERSLVAGPAVLEALTGQDGWPPDLSTDRLPAPTNGLGDWFDLPTVAAAIQAIGRGTASAFLTASGRPDTAGARLAALALRAGAEPVILRSAALTSAAVQLALVLGFVRGQLPVFCDWNDSAATLELSIPYVGLPVLLARLSASVVTYPRPLVSIPVPAMSLADRRDALRSAAPGLDLPESVSPASAEPRDLALAARDLEGALEARGHLNQESGAQIFLAAVDRRTAPSIPAGAELFHPQRSWADLVLPSDRLDQLREAVSRARIQAQWSRAGRFPSRPPGERGLSILLCGPPGTGKTTVTEVIARDLGRDVLQIDLSRLVSKWIGETEKNLAGVFNAAERDDLVLFFDEADVIFTNRTKVDDARDRYANLETAYLLTRLEQFSGIAILATNLRRNIDSAFARRIEFIVQLDPPDLDARRRLWELLLPDWVRLSDEVDLDELAALYQLSGALIRGAAYAAAYLAAGDGSSVQDGESTPVVTLDHLAHAIRREYAKAGLALPGPPLGRLRRAERKSAATAR